jgi:hypothetical protein
MRIYILILFIASISLLISCNKDKDKKDNSPAVKDYYEILGEGTGWHNFKSIRLVNPMWGWFNDHEFIPIELKAYGDKFELYTQEKLRAQQDYQYTFKIFTMNIDNADSTVESPFNFDYSRDQDIILGYVIINERPDYFLTTTTYDGYYNHIVFNDKNNIQVFNKEIYGHDLYPPNIDYIYTDEKRLFLMGFTPYGTEFKLNPNDGIHIRNLIADSAMAMKSFYYENRAELQELFVSENGFMTAAVMQKEIDYNGNFTNMISVNFYKAVTCDSSALISVAKRTDGKYNVSLYSGKDSKLNQYIYDPEFYTFEKVYENRSVPANLLWIEVTTTGKVYMRTLDNLYQTNATAYTEIPLAIFKPKIEVDANVRILDFRVRRDRLFAFVQVETGYPDPPQVSIIEYTGN